jgi:hypothetical protein
MPVCDIAPDSLICSTAVTIPTIIPHADFGDPSCCGCLTGEVHGDVAAISCNECGAIVRTVPASELQHTLDEMEASLDLAITICQHCGAVIHQPGFAKLTAFVCDWCGKSNDVVEG